MEKVPAHTHTHVGEREKKTKRWGKRRSKRNENNVESSEREKKAARI